MKYILLAFTLMLSQSFAEVSMRPPEEVTKPIHPIVRPEKPKKYKEKYLLLHQDNHYYTNVVSNCNKYLKLIEQKEKEIEVLKKEIKRLRGSKQVELQKKLNEEYELQLKMFDERKSGIRTQNRMRISNEPAK